MNHLVALTRWGRGKKGVCIPLRENILLGGNSFDKFMKIQTVEIKKTEI